MPAFQRFRRADQVVVFTRVKERSFEGMKCSWGLDSYKKDSSFECSQKELKSHLTGRIKREICPPPPSLLYNRIARLNSCTLELTRRQGTMNRLCSNLKSVGRFALKQANKGIILFAIHNRLLWRYFLF